MAVVDADRFMDMPTSAQALYFHLGMHGDDDGFVSSPKKIQRSAGCNDDDLKLLIAKGFIIPFDSGVVVITDWKINNTLKNDRYAETIYQDEKATLQLGDNGKYALVSSMDPEWNQNGTMLVPQHNEVKLCTLKGCALYPFREGHNPYIAKREYTDEQKEAIKTRLMNSRLSTAMEKSQNAVSEC